ncbi:class I SAM-dependent methyltransferase [Flagellimonas ochracea]|nr:class I SAM-dependent methyltransferase [Allomuricauda ochracea]
MDSLNKKIETHYLKKGLYEDILVRLKEQNIDLNQVTRHDIAGVDEFHVRGSEVSKELASSINIKGSKVLDMGSGIGGPCRMLAHQYDCDTIGIDLSSEFVKTANALSKLVGLNHKTKFIQGSATALPFDDNSFDVVWTQHVQMNIPDKQKFYGEARRVLKPGGYFLYYDIFTTHVGPIEYPMPWANHESFSFLIGIDEVASILNNLGFLKISTTNQTEAGITFFKSLFTKIETSGPPKVSLSLLMGESTLSKLSNLFSHLQKNLLILESGVYQKTN